MPMPVELEITDVNGKKERHYIPFELMRANKPFEADSVFVHPAWRFTDQVYKVSMKRQRADVVSIELDPNRGAADVNRKNNLIKPNNLLEFIELNNR